MLLIPSISEYSPLVLWQVLRAELAVRCQDGRVNPWEVFILFFTPLTIALSAPWRCTERWCSRCSDDRSGLASSTLPFWSLFCTGLFCPPCHQKYATCVLEFKGRRKCLTCTLPVGLSLSTHAHHFSLLSPSLYISYIFYIQYSLSPSVSINHSWLAAAD